MSVISAGTTTTTAFKVTGDTTGTLQLKTGAVPTTAIDISATQVVTFPATTTLDFTGTLLLGDGSAAAPTLAHSGDTNTGMFFPAADTIAFTEGGTEVLRLNSSAQVAVNTAGTAAAPVITKTDDLNTGIFFPAADTIAFAEGGVESMRIDSSGNVGIGTISPLGTLGIAGSATATIVIPRSSNGSTASPVETQLIGSTFTNGTFAAGMYALNSFINNSGNWLAFKTTDTGNTTATRMTLDASGNLGIGTTSTGNNRLIVSSAVTGSNNTNLRVECTGSGGSSIDFASGSTGHYIFGNGSLPLVFGTNGTERARFNTTGAFVFAGGTTTADGIGITFPATQSASSNANTLDDYEEGSWTPRLTGTGGGDYTPSGLNGGRYIKIGKMVWATATLQWGAQVTPYSGLLAVSGLPFTCVNNRACGSMGAILFGLSFTAGYGEWNYLIDPGQASVYIIQNSTTGAGYSHTPTVGTSGVCYGLTIVYETT